MYVPMSLSTWESVLSTLIRITKALMPSEPPKDRLSTLCGRLAMPLFQVGLRSVDHVVLELSIHLIDGSIDWLIDWLSDWLIDRSIDWLIDRLIEWLIEWSIDWLSDWLLGIDSGLYL